MIKNNVIKLDYHNELKNIINSFPNLNNAIDQVYKDFLRSTFIINGIKINNLPSLEYQFDQLLNLSMDQSLNLTIVDTYYREIIYFCNQSIMVSIMNYFYKYLIDSDYLFMDTSKSKMIFEIINDDHKILIKVYKSLSIYDPDLFLVANYNFTIHVDIINKLFDFYW